MKSKIIILCLIVSVLIINTLIFLNSFDDVVASQEKSDAISGVVESVVSGKSDNEWQFDVFVRKFAHVFEFSLLGIVLTSCLYLVKQCYSKRFYGFGCFYVLAVAVLDEYIQSFSNRTSSVNDILLDFSGFLIGAVLVFVGIFVFKVVRKTKENRATE